MALVVFFVLNLLAMIGSVVVNSFSTRWFNTWLPAGYTGQWYSLAWNEFRLSDILIVTVEVVGAMVRQPDADRRAGEAVGDCPLRASQ